MTFVISFLLFEKYLYEQRGFTMKTKCSSCPVNRKRKSNFSDRLLSWGIRIILAVILATAAYEQFVKAPVSRQDEKNLTAK